MFDLSPTELIIIAVIILFIFGAKRLPGIGKTLGETLKEVNNIKKEIDPKILKKQSRKFRTIKKRQKGRIPNHP